MEIRDLYSDHLDDIDEDYHDVFLDLVGGGSSPKVVAASIEYVTTPKSQNQCSEEYGCSDMSIRSTYPAVVALSGEDVESYGKNTSTSKLTAADLCEAIADELGWEEGDEYTVTTTYTGDTPQPSVNKAGLRSIVEELIDNGE